MSGWIPFPKSSLMLDPGGKVTGAVTVSWQDEGHAYVGTDGAHINDDNLGVVFRGAGYLVSLRLRRGPDGYALTESYSSVTRRENWSEAPPSYRAAIVAAICEAVTALADASPDMVRAGEYAGAVQDASRAAEDVAKIEPELREARKRAREARARMTRYAVQS